MPTRADIEAATPKCPARVGRRMVRGHWCDPTCNQPLSWLHALARWTCEDHGAVLTAESASQRWRSAAGLMHFDGAL